MALPQDGQNANGLTKVTEIPKGKELIFIDPTTNEGGIITLEDLTTQILKNLTSQTFALDQGNMTLLAALNQLNSNKIRTKNITELFYFSVTATTGSQYGDFAFYFDEFEYNNDPAISINPIDGVSFVINSFLINETTRKINGVRLQARKNGAWLISTKLSVTGTVIGQ